MKKNKALILIDNSDFGEIVLKRGLEWCNQQEIEPIIFYCYEPNNYYYGAEFDIGFSNSFDYIKSNSIKSIKDKVSKYKLNLIVREGNVLSEIIKESNKELYKLIIMGNSGKSFLERILFGYKVDKVLRKVNKDFLLIAEKSGDNYTKAVGLDFSAESNELIEKLDVYINKNEKLSLLALVTPMTIIHLKDELDPSKNFIDQLDKGKEIVLKKIKAIENKVSKSYDTSVIVKKIFDNRVDELLLRELKKNKLNTLMVGPHSRTILDKLFFISVTDLLIKSAEINLYINRH